MEKSVFTHEYRVLLRLFRETREAANLTQVQLAEKLGQSQSFVSKCERGERRLDMVQLRTICKLLEPALRNSLLNSSAVWQQRKIEQKHGSSRLLGQQWAASTWTPASRHQEQTCKCRRPIGFIQEREVLAHPWSRSSSPATDSHSRASESLAMSCGNGGGENHASRPVFLDPANFGFLFAIVGEPLLRHSSLRLPNKRLEIPQSCDRQDDRAAVWLARRFILGPNQLGFAKFFGFRMAWFSVRHRTDLRLARRSKLIAWVGRPVRFSLRT